MKQRSRERPAAPFLVGWLFADMLLALVVIVLGGEQAGGRTPPPPPPTTGAATTTAATTAPTAIPSTPPTTQANGLDPNSTSVTIHVDGQGVINHDPKALAAMDKAVLDKIKHFQPQRAALVIVWGAMPSCAGCGFDTGSSSALAAAAGAEIEKNANPDFFPRNSESLFRTYLDVTGRTPPNSIRLELFFLIHQ